MDRAKLKAVATKPERRVVAAAAFAAANLV
jgi:hypothetical protein